MNVYTSLSPIIVDRFCRLYFIASAARMRACSVLATTLNTTHMHVHAGAGMRRFAAGGRGGGGGGAENLQAPLGACLHFEHPLPDDVARSLSSSVEHRPQRAMRTALFWPGMVGRTYRLQEKDLTEEEQVIEMCARQRIVWCLFIEG